MDWLAFAGSILGGLIGGLFTFLGVTLTLKHEKGKERRELIERANETRPRLEIERFRGLDETADDKTFNIDCNVLALNIESYREDNGRARFYYNPAALQRENLVFVEYILKNTGLTEIEQICVTSNFPKQISAVELEKRDMYINDNLLNCGVWANKRYIKPGKTVTLRFYYIKGQIILLNLGSGTFTVWLHDVNGRIWKQSLNSPKDEIELSQLSNGKTFLDSIDMDKAIDCFNNPMLW